MIDESALRKTVRETLRELVRQEIQASRDGAPSSANDMWIHERDVALMTGETRETVRRWRSNNEGPPFVKGKPVGVRYSWREVREWMATGDRSAQVQHDKRERIPRLRETVAAAIAALPTCCKARGGFVYVVEGADLVKIGCSHRLAFRLSALQAANPYPLQLLAIGRGASFESHFHTRFRDHRQHGEWFAGAPVKSWLAEQKSNRCITCSLVAERGK